MAEEENEDLESSEDESTEGKGGKKKLFLIIGGVVLLLVLIGVPTAYFVFSSGDDEAVVEGVDPQIAADKELVLMMEGFDEEDEYDEDEVPLGAFYPFETFVVNLAGGGYLRTQVHIEFSGRDVPKRFYGKLIPIRDALINMFSNQTRADLSDESQRGDLKNEIKRTVNTTLKKELVKKVYFTQFIIQ